jgi:hypothetical protein
LVNSRLSRFTAALSPPHKEEATRAPLLPKVRGQFAEFLDRGWLVHLGGSPPAYRCRCAVRAARASGERLFWATWARRTSALARELVPAVTVLPDRDLPRSAASAWQPVLSIRPAACPYRVPALLLTTPAGAGISDLLAIAYDYNVLGLGPDSPWDD